MAFLRMLLASVALLPLADARGETTWQEIKGDHFIVRYDPSTVRPASVTYRGEIGQFAADVLASAENHYRRIASDLGYSRSTEFWTWDRRVKIIIYPDRDSYVASTGHPSWSQGMSDYAKKEITGYAFSEYLIDRILPHEMTHLILRDFVGKGEIPRWLDEGVAQWEEDPRRTESRQIMRACLEKDILLSMEEMGTININIVDKFFAGMPDQTWLAKAGKQLMAIYYAESISLVSFLVTTYGPEDFSRFCRLLRDGKPLETALVTAYAKYFKTVRDFEEAWKKSLAQP